MKTVKVEYQEQSKGVIAHVKVEVTDEKVDLDKIAKEAEDLMSYAMVKSRAFSIAKQR